jgi:hypothetical protein
MNSNGQFELQSCSRVDYTQLGNNFSVEFTTKFI